MASRSISPYEEFLLRLISERRERLKELTSDPGKGLKRRKDVERIESEIALLEGELKSYGRKVVEHRPKFF